MQKTLKKTMICCAALFAVLTLLFALYGFREKIFLIADTAREKAVSDILSTGYIGEEFDIPEYVCKIDGKEVKADIRILSPDGSAYGGTKLRLGSAGKYTVEYMIDGSVQESFSCIAVRRPTDMFSLNKYVSMTGIEKYPYSESDFSGVKAAVSEGAEIVFEREIDMTSKTKDDILVQMLIEPSVRLERDFGQLILKFTDVEDADVNMTVIASDGNLDSLTTSGVSYVRAGGNGQTACGREYKGSQWVYSTVDIYGSPAPFSFEANVWPSTEKYDYALNLCYDAAENAVYLKNGSSSFYGEPYLIVDFDDVSVFGAGIWNGFPSGRAKLSVTFDKFVKNTGYVIFTQIDGIDLSEERIVDDTAPEIEIDLQREEKAPNSYLGAEYRIFDATATDFFDGNCRVWTEVKYSNMISDVLYDVSVRNDTFVTDKVGIYTIFYYASDLSGNTSFESLSFYCTGSSEKISIEGIEEELSVSVFDKVVLTATENVRAYGGSGRLEVSLSVFDPEGNELEIADNVFVPDRIGDYVITYTATDYFGSQEKKEQILHVEPLDKPVFINEVLLPEVVVAGFTYEMPSASAKFCNNSKIEDAEVKVFIDGKEIPERSFSVSGNADSVLIEYRAYGESENLYESFTKIIPIIDGKNGKDQAAYFYNADGNIFATEERNSVKLNVSRDGSVFFANRLNGNAFGLNVAYSTLKTNFSSMTVSLMDSSDKTRSITANITFTTLGLTISAPGLNSGTFAVRSDGNLNYFTLSYGNTRRTLGDIDGNDFCVLSVDDKGNVFTGFKTGIYMTVSFNGVKADSEIEITSINNQTFGYKNTAADPLGDTVAPEIVINGTFIKRVNAGSSATIFSAEAYDVLGQVSSLTVSVYAPDNSRVLDGVSADRDYTIQLDRVGRYRIIYTATDSYGNSQGGTAGTNILVLDSVPPVLEVSGSLKEVYKIGASISLPQFSVSDNMDNAYCDVFVQLPDGEIRLLLHGENGEITSYLSKADATYPNSFKADDNTFKPESAGKYIITYLAYDDSYNYVIKQFVITVTA